jgi:hypothetical protein
MDEPESKDLFFSSFFEDIVQGKIDLLKDRIRVLLVRDYTPSHDDEWADVWPFEIEGTGYDRGGVSLTSRTLEVDGDRTILRCDSPVVWFGHSANGATFTASGAIIYKDGQLDDGRRDPRLISYLDFGGPKMVMQNAFTIDFSDGVLYLGGVSARRPLIEDFSPAPKLESE